MKAEPKHLPDVPDESRDPESRTLRSWIPAFAGKIGLMISCLILAACATQSDGADAAARAVPEPSLEKIAAGVWIHKSYERIEPLGPILSQGMVVKTDAGVFLIDTAWNDADTEELLALVKAETGERPRRCCRYARASR